MNAVPPKIVLGVAAHPDDLDFCAGGSLAAMSRDGAAIYYLILTDGSKGTTDRAMSREKLTAIRQDEQREALKRLGGKDVFFLNYCDGELEVTVDVKRKIVRTIRQLKPNLVITFDPSMVYAAEFGFINHPDHRAAGQATLDAVFPLARDHMEFPELKDEGLEPHKTAEVWLTNFNTPNHYVDITNTFDLKLSALAAHESQIPDVQLIEQKLRTQNGAAGKAAGCDLAESFVKIVID